MYSWDFILYLIDHLRGFHLYITSSQSTIPEEDRVYEDRITKRQYDSGNATYNIVTSHRGRYVIIELARRESHLVLCEVEVYEGMSSLFMKLASNYRKQGML